MTWKHFVPCLVALLLCICGNGNADGSHVMESKRPPAPPRAAPPRPHDPLLPTIVYAGGCSTDAFVQTCHRNYIEEKLEACGYPNLHKIQDPQNPEALAKMMASPKSVPQGRDNYLVILNMHGGNPADTGYHISDGSGKVSTSGDDTVRMIAKTLNPDGAKELNVWLETCHAGACKASPEGTNIGCACGPEQVTMSIPGPMGLISDIACDAASGRCAYFHDRNGQPTFDKNGDGKLTGAELSAAYHHYYKEPFETSKECVETASAGKVADTARMKRSLNRCIDGYRNWCNERKGTPGSNLATAFEAVFSVKVSGSFNVMDAKGKESRLNFRDVILHHSSRQNTYAGAMAVLKEATDNPKTFAAAFVTPVMILQYTHDKKHGGVALPAQNPNLTIDAATNDRAYANIRRIATCAFGPGASPTPGYAEGVQIPELRNFTLSFPRCALRNRRLMK